MPGYRQLPAEGRKGPPPDFPLPNPTEGELQVWAGLWKLPQAVEWERLEYTRVVGRYCRMLVDTEEHSPKIQMLVEVRQLEDRLGLSPRSLVQLRWEVADPQDIGIEPVQRVTSAPYIPKVKQAG
jgi:hypothetical protein